ncbi:MAG: hypothetical protein LBD11_02375 [Candidatus Peribacteria bacterium]|jgi:uncharacterized surface protein with fasciclin (FAS1) repeats|nr:hypothetical protein [Candidatus Peribacteria bacterium]
MKYHIISIGVGKYDDCSLNLTTPELDATDFYNFALNSFDNNLGINELLVNENASLSKIQVALGNSSLHQIDKDDCFIFYFSGH